MILAGRALTAFAFILLGCYQACGNSSWVAGPGFRSRLAQPSQGGKPGFVPMLSSQTGISFTNILGEDAFLTNAVAHNGSGVAIGDVDGDDRPDIHFCNLQGPNELYRNLGDWRFEPMALGEASCAGQFSTGAVFADVDGDGDLDLLVNGISAGTRLFLNDGKGRWTEAVESGLSRTASATSMALADMDGDGDLDLYCTHFIDAMLLADPTTRFALARRGDQWEVTRVNGESARLARWKDRFEAFPDGKVRELPEVHGLYRNDGKGRFKAIQFEPGVYSDHQGKPIPPYRDWGLAVMFRDLNRDGIPDLYVCNDNTSPDRIWINSGQGTFRASDPGMFRHTSRSSMGVDVADLDRDGHDDIVVVDMLARDHSKRMTQLVRDRPNPIEIELMDSRPQYNRNTLFLGRPDGSFVETAFMAGVAATDWTWAAIFLDVDLDGYEDFLVTNGFEFDVMDQDSHNVIKDPRRRHTEAQLKRSMQFHPRWPTRNAAFRNRRNGTFEPMGAEWGFELLGVSFGLAQADLDADGDLDLVVNNLNAAASLYRNEAAAPRIAVRLKGLGGNTQGIGARIEIVGGSIRQAQEMISGGRYLSGDQALRVFAADLGAQQPLRAEIRWRDGSRSSVDGILPNRTYEISQSHEASRVHASAQELHQAAHGERVGAKALPPLFSDVSTLIRHEHAESVYDDWARQPTLPRRLSRLGPGIGWHDLDQDGWEDLMVGAGRGGNLAVYKNEHGSHFKKLEGMPAAVGDQGAVLGWADGRGNRMLLVANSNYELASEQQSEIHAHSIFSLHAPERWPAGSASLGPLAAADIDGDGDLDVFVGGRSSPGRYPEPVSSSIWINQSGKLARQSSAGDPFKSIGMVSGATFLDLDGDGDSDLALAMEWGPVRVFQNEGGLFEERTARWGCASLTGWWTSVTAGDFDGDGRMDLACGNWGRNTVYELLQPTVFRLYHGDWDHSGVVQMIESWQSGTNWFPVHDRTWLSRGFPGLSELFPTHLAFSKATIADWLGKRLESVSFVEAAELSSMVFLNRGARFEAVPLPSLAQLAPVFAINVGDADGDGVEDLFLSQNFFGTASDISRDDSGRGLWLLGKGDGTFTGLDASVSGVKILGEQRGAALADFNHDGKIDLVVSQNSSATKLYLNRGARQGLRVVLRGAPANPDGVGSQMRAVYANKRMGPCRTVQAGSGYWSQDAAAQVLGLIEPPAAVWVRWPGGTEQVVAVPNQQRTIEITNQE